MSGLEIITISSQIKDSKGNIIGAIGASIPLEHLSHKLRTKVGRTGFPILVSKSGKFLVHPERELISQKITLDDPIFEVVLKNNSGTLDIVAPYDGKRKFFSFMPLAEANWIVLVIQPLSEFHVENLKFLTRNAVLIFLVIFILALASYYLTLLRKREEEARFMQAEKLSLVGQLAAGMAHEIRNPLTSIKGLAQLAATRENALALDHLEIILREVNRIESIVKETMLLAKPSPVEFKAVDISLILGEVFALMQPQLHLKGVKLTLSTPKNLPVIKGDPNQLKQVFINLIKNSIEAAPPNNGKILVEAKRVENNIIVITQDNGFGIPKEMLDKLGTPFLSTKENGTGLGLMVSYRIIQNHGGKINAQSIQFQGTTFTIEFPIP